MLSIENLHGGYEAGLVLHGVNLTVEEGEVVCLIGRNGVGKTSILRSIVGEQILVRSGRISFDDRDLVGLPPHEITHHGIALVPEDRRVFPTLTVLENLSIPRTVRNAASGYWTLDRVYELFPQLRSYRDRKAGVLSGGEQQMLSIARSLLLNPKLLLLDEPHEGLAPVVSQAVVDVINQLKGRGIAMILSEQALHLVHECADRVYVIDRGSVAFEGTPAEFDADPSVAEKYLMIM